MAASSAPWGWADLDESGRGGLGRDWGAGDAAEAERRSANSFNMFVPDHSHIPARRNRTDVYFVMIGLMIPTTGRAVEWYRRPVVRILSPIMTKYTSVRLCHAGIYILVIRECPATVCTRWLLDGCFTFRQGPQSFDSSRLGIRSFLAISASLLLKSK